MVVELYDARLVPIVYLQNIKSDMEYIRSKDNKLMDAADDAAKKTIQEDIQTHIASMKEKLSKYKSDSDYKELLDNFNKYVAANDFFIKSNGVGAIKVQSAVSGPPIAMLELDTTKSNLALSFNKIIDNQVSEAKQTYDQSKSVYSATLVGLISLIIVCAVIMLILSIIITKAVVSPVKRVTEKLIEISQSNGDLTKRIDYNSKDKIGELSSSFDLFMDKLHKIIKDVSDLIKENQFKAKSAVTSVSLVEEKVSLGVSKASEVGHIIQNIIENIQNISNQIEEIDKLAENHAYGANQTEKAIGSIAAASSEIALATENISSSVEEQIGTMSGIEKTSESLSEMAKPLNNITSGFKV